MPLPVNLTVQPASQKWHGHPVYVRIADDGALPLKVTTRPVLLHSHCVMTSQHGMTVSPASFTLEPGSAITVAVTAPNVRGDYGVLFQGAAIGPHHSVLLSGAVGSQILSGNAVSCAPPRVAAPHAHTAMAGLPLSMIAGLAIAVVLLIAAGVMYRNRRKAA